MRSTKTAHQKAKESPTLKLASPLVLPVADNACVKLIQWPIIVLGIVVLVVALAGFVGAFWRIPGLLLFYLAAMVMLILALAARRLLRLAAAAGGGTERWNRIKACLSSTSTCSELNQTYNLAQDFFNAELSPLQSGCCKPPTRCGYTFVNPTYWISPIDTASDVDCVLWSNDQMQLCYSCSSCKAGLLANLRREWRRADLLLVAALIALITVYAMGCYAFRAAKTDDIFRRYKQGYT
uniref:Protein TORNADO 2 n=1 Tax=Ananas comosus var. bracteatus TaxID=296719 RepID=A0A6V7QXU8_ANACO